MLRRVATLLAGIVVGLLLAEGLLRVYLAAVPPPRDAPFVADDAAGYRLRPDSPEQCAAHPDDCVNSLGFRDHEHPRQKPSGTYRIVGIGDSFVYGSTARLADHFLEVAAAQLQAQCPTSATAESLRVEMVLMGVGGYSPVNEVGVLRAHALPLDPDLVILNFYVGNDVTAIPLRAEVWRGQLYYTGSIYPLLNLLRRSALFTLAEHVFLVRVRAGLLRLWLDVSRRVSGSARRTGDHAAPARDAPAAGAGTSVSSDEQSTSIWALHQQKKDLPVFRRVLDRRTERLWQQAEGCLSEFDRLCRAADVAWCLCVIPASIQVDGRLREHVLSWLRHNPADYDFDGPQRRLHAFADARGILILDPLDTLRVRLDPAAPLYERNDIHWTVRGNRVAGEVLGAGLAREWPALAGGE
jgi:hypothetical protein